MGRLLKTSNTKKISRDCIFCGFEYRNKDYLYGTKTGHYYIPPLKHINKGFHLVCIYCVPTLEYYKKKYPDLWE